MHTLKKVVKIDKMCGYINILKMVEKTCHIYDGKYIKTKTKTLSSIINTLFSGDEIPKERIHYVCIPAICVDSVLRIDKKNYPQVYLEQCKYKTKRDLDSDLDK